MITRINKSYLYHAVFVSIFLRIALLIIGIEIIVVGATERRKQMISAVVE